MELLHSGKIRDVYADGDDILLVASDKVSVYDVVLPTLIPDKGKILTQLSLWWFDQLADLVPNHVISATDVPSEWAGRAIRCRRLDMLPVECIARGYLAGLGLDSYKATRTISGVPLPEGLSEGSQLPEPVFTPTTKATVGHDEFIDLPEVEAAVGADTARELKRLTLEVYERGAEIAAARGIIIADTKLEFGLAPDGTHRPRRRGAHPGLLPVLGGQRVAARRSRSTTWTSSSSATGRQPSRAGTASHPAPRSRRTSSTPPAPGTSRSTSASPAPSGEASGGLAARPLPY